MESKALRHLASRLQLAYYPRGAPIVSPEAGPVRNLYIIKQGSVRGAPAGALPGSVDIVMGAGECFPLGALLAGRAPVYTYRSEGDCFCWELAAEDFHGLMARSPRFRTFCTGQLAQLVEQSQRALRLEASDGVAGGMLRPLREVIPRSPVSCAPQTPVREVLKTMHELRIGSMLVADADGMPKGIFTTFDVLERVALPQADVDAPISSLMSGGVIALEEEAPVVDAALAMVRHGIRHVVVTRDGRLAGVISERDLFGMQRSSLRRIVERVRASATVARLAEAAAEVRDFARALLAQGVAAEQLTQMTCALNDSITGRAIELALPGHKLEGAWCWLALGSEGRLEQTLATDQDNALIFASTGERDAERKRFLGLAQDVNIALGACGFPLCKGDIMARNPKWCLSLEEWRAVFGAWIRNPEPQALLHANIFSISGRCPARRGWPASCATACCRPPPATQRSDARWRRTRCRRAPRSGCCAISHSIRPRNFPEPWTSRASACGRSWTARACLPWPTSFRQPRRRAGCAPRPRRAHCRRSRRRRWWTLFSSFRCCACGINTWRPASPSGRRTGSIRIASTRSTAGS